MSEKKKENPLDWSPHPQPVRLRPDTAELAQTFRDPAKGWEAPHRDRFNEALEKRFADLEQRMADLELLFSQPSGAIRFLDIIPPESETPSDDV